MISDSKYGIFLVMVTNDTICLNNPAFHQLKCDYINIIEGITLENHVFLISQLPCCAQLALPFWAKITGRIHNNRAEDVFLTIAATIFDNDGSLLAVYTDVIALDEEQKGEFEVKLVEHNDRAKTYALTIKEMEQY